MSIYTCRECNDAAFQALYKTIEDKILLNREEAQAIVRTLAHGWVPLDDQKIVYDLVRRIEKELESET